MVVAIGSAVNRNGPSMNQNSCRSARRSSVAQLSHHQLSTMTTKSFQPSPGNRCEPKHNEISPVMAPLWDWTNDAGRTSMRRSWSVGPGLTTPSPSSLTARQAYPVARTAWAHPVVNKTHVSELAPGRPSGRIERLAGRHARRRARARLRAFEATDSSRRLDLDSRTGAGPTTWPALTDPLYALSGSVVTRLVPELRDPIAPARKQTL